MNSLFVNPFEKMLQGLAYWLAYQNVILGCDIIEADAVKEAGVTRDRSVTHDVRCLRAEG